MLKMQRNFGIVSLDIIHFYTKSGKGKQDLFTDRNKRMGNLSLLPLE
jgi:hypothetical protein